MESVEREKDEDELDHRGRRPREQHAREQARKARDLEEAPVARRRLGGEFDYRATLPNQPERSGIAEHEVDVLGRDLIERRRIGPAVQILTKVRESDLRKNDISGAY